MKHKMTAICALCKRPFGEHGSDFQSTPNVPFGCPVNPVPRRFGPKKFKPIKRRSAPQ